MAVQVNWGNDTQTMVIFEFIDPWTWDDYKEATSVSDALLTSVSHKVDLLLDLSAGGNMPNGALHHLRDKAKNANPNRGRVVVVGANRMIQMIGNILENLFPRTIKDIKFFPTREEAIAFLSSH